jgi:hypothetical protein
MDRQAILGGSAPGESYLQDPAPFLGKTLEGTLSLVPRGTEATVSHPMKGPMASHPGSRDHHKIRKFPRLYSLSKNTRSTSLLILEPASQLFLLLPDPGPLRKYCSGHIRTAPRASFHSDFSLILGRFPFLSLLFNCPRNPYPSARVRPSI